MKKLIAGLAAAGSFLSGVVVAQDVHSQHHPEQSQKQMQKQQQTPMMGMMGGMMGGQGQMMPYGYMLVPIQPGMMGGMMPMMGMMGGMMNPMGMMYGSMMSDPKLRKIITEHQKKCKEELMKKLSKHPSFAERLINMLVMHPEAVKKALKKNPALKKKLEEIVK